MREFFQTFLAMAFDLTGLAFGFYVYTSLPSLSPFPWALPLYATFLTLRGCISGIFTGELTTGVNTGKIREWTDRGVKELSLAVLSFSFVSGSITVAFLYSFLPYPSVLPFSFSLLLLTTLTSLSLSLFLTFFLKSRNLNPDIIVYPVMSTVDDFLLTVFLLLLLPSSTSLIPLFSLFIFLGLLASFFTLKTKRGLKMVSTYLFSLLIVSLISASGGFFVKKAEETVERYLPIFPVINDLLGDMVAVVASEKTSGLGSRRIYVDSFLSGVAVFSIASLIVYPFTGFPFPFCLILLPAYLILLLLLFFILKVFRFDPDAFAIPVLTASADALIPFLLSLI